MRTAGQGKRCGSRSGEDEHAWCSMVFGAPFANIVAEVVSAIGYRLVPSNGNARETIAVTIGRTL